MSHDKTVEERHQTQQKLEVMERYWVAWCTILAQARDFQFCPTRLWLVDTHAGRGLHESSGDPDGQIPGTPLLAVLAARNTQRHYPDVEVRARATDKDPQIAKALDLRLNPYRGDPPAGVDVRVEARDWVDAVGSITAEIAFEGHEHGGRAGRNQAHSHRSLWFIDPFGVEGIDHSVISRLPVGAEVIINLDLMGLLRHIGKAARDDKTSTDILLEAYGSRIWEEMGTGPEARPVLAQALADSFPRWEFRRSHLLRPTGSQDRALIHLTGAATAERKFEAVVKTALKAGTVIAGSVLTTVEKNRAAARLASLFAGLTVDLDAMRGATGFYNKSQLKVMCRRASEKCYGDFDEDTGLMTWFTERAPGPDRAARQASSTLWESSDSDESGPPG
jgi:three-Cys-motif partner protein